MKQLKQEKQFDDAKESKRNKDENSETIFIHNPNTRESTAKYLAKLLIQGLEKNYPGDEL